MAISVNRVFYTWHDLEFSIVRDGAASEIVTEINAINYSHSTAITNVYGAGRKPIAQCVGQYVLDESTLTLYKAAWEALKAELGPGWQGTAVSINVSYRGETEPLQTTLIEGRIKGESEDLAVGDDALVVNVTIVPSKILGNGIDPVKTTGA